MSMRFFSHWSIRYKLLSLLLLLGVTTFAVTGTIAYLKYLAALKQNVMNQLTGVTRSKRFQIESYYQTIHHHAETLSDDRMFIDAMKEFGNAYRRMDAIPIPAAALEAVREDYKTNYFPQMQKLKMARSHVEDYLPFSPAAIQLQYLYIVKNPNPQGHREDWQTPTTAVSTAESMRNTTPHSSPSSRSLATTTSISSTTKPVASSTTRPRTVILPPASRMAPTLTAISPGL